MAQRTSDRIGIDAEKAAKISICNDEKKIDYLCIYSEKSAVICVCMKNTQISSNKNIEYE